MLLTVFANNINCINLQQYIQGGGEGIFLMMDNDLFRMCAIYSRYKV